MQVIISLDIGGSTSRVGLIHYVTFQPLWSHKQTTPKGFVKVLNIIKELYQLARDACNQLNLAAMPTICLSLPGNFPMGKHIELKEGSALQILNYEAPICPKKASKKIQEAMSIFPNWFALNDGWAQCIGGVHQLWSKEMMNHRFLYIGIGTGLGGAVVEVRNSPLDVEFITDGHIYDIVCHHGMAEDIVSGRAIQTMFDMDAKRVVRLPCIWQQDIAFKTITQTMIEIVHHIKKGTVKKQQSRNQWPINERRRAQGISGILLGGSIGAKSAFGMYCRNVLRQTFPSMIIHQVVDSDCAGLQGAAINQRINAFKTN